MIRFSTTYGAALASYEGIGTIVTTDDTFSCTFECRQLHDGACILLASKLTSTFAPGTLRFPFPVVRHFHGQLADGRRIESVGPMHQLNVLDLTEGQDIFEEVAFRLRSFIVRGDEHVVGKARYGLTNFFFAGPGGRLESGRYSLPLKLVTQDRQVRAYIIPLVDQHELWVQVTTTRSIAVTSDVELWGDGTSGTSSITDLDDIASDLCYVLSVAAGTKVQWIYKVTLSEDGREISAEHHHRITRPYGPHHLISYQWSAERHAAFIEPGFTAFSADRERFRLSAVVDAYLEAKTEGDFIETRTLKLAVALEALKHAFVESRGWDAEHFIEDAAFKKLKPKLRRAIKQTLSDNGVSEAIVADIAKSGHDGGLNRRTFGQVVSALAEEIGLVLSSDDLVAFTRSRNTLVHQGRFYASVAKEGSLAKMPYNSPREEHWFDMYFLDRLILCILRYDGEFVDARLLSPRAV